MHKLPIGIQAFEVLRTQGFVYVDKTEWIHQLARENQVALLGLMADGIIPASSRVD